MSTTPLSMIEAVRDYLALCPALTSFSDNIGINYLGEDCEQYSVIDVPVTPLLQTFYDGSKDKTFAFAINSRSFYSGDIALMSGNDAVFESVSDWIEAQNDLGNYPNIGTGKEPYKIEVTTSTFVVDNELSEAVYQIQCRMDYYVPA